MSVPVWHQTLLHRSTQTIAGSVFILFCVASAMVCLIIPLHFVVVGCFVLSAATVISIKYAWGIYPLLFLIPVNSTYIGITIKRLWPFHIGDTLMDTVPLFAPLMLLVFSSFLLSKWSKTHRSTPYNPLRPALVVLLTYAALQILWVPDRVHSIHQYLLLCLNIMLFAVVTHAINDDASHRRLVWAWVWVGIVLGIIMCALFFVESKELMHVYELLDGVNLDVNIKAGAMTTGGKIRRGTSLTTSHESGLIINVAFAAALGLLLTEKHKGKRKLLMAFLAFFIAINLLGMSRGALGAMIVMVVYLLATISVLKKHFYVLLTAFLVFFMGTMFVENMILSDIFLRNTATPRVIEMFSRKSDSNENVAQQQVPGRIKIWQQGLGELRNTLYTGLGPGNFKYLVKAPHAHSIYFSFLFDFGLLGAGIIAAIVMTIIRDTSILLRSQATYSSLMGTALSGGAVAVALHGLVDFEYNTTSLWFFLALLLSVIGLTKKDAARASFQRTT
jgi:oligosaccharide repeat unit polymerase